MNPVLFHIAFPVTNIHETKTFYVDGLGCQEGRETAKALILNLYNHQIIAHVVSEPIECQKGIYPRHFGLVFTAESDWECLLNKVQLRGLKFYQEPRCRFPGSLIEHRTFFLEDPFKNLLEFKYYCHSEAIFETRELSLIGDV